MNHIVKKDKTKLQPKQACFNFHLDITYRQIRYPKELFSIYVLVDILSCILSFFNIFTLNLNLKICKLKISNL